MGRQIKNAKVIQAKAKKNTVNHIGGGLYEVISSTSGNAYSVRIAGNSGSCTCD